METYTGSWTDEGVVVLVDGRLLNPRLDLANTSPTGFAWGYGGSGPGQLALAILADCLQDDEEALQWYQCFKLAGDCRLGPVRMDVDIRGGDTDAGSDAIRCRVLARIAR